MHAEPFHPAVLIIMCFLAEWDGRLRLTKQNPLCDLNVVLFGHHSDELTSSRHTPLCMEKAALGADTSWACRAWRALAEGGVGTPRGCKHLGGPTRAQPRTDHTRPTAH